MEVMQHTTQTPIDQRVARVVKIMLAVREENQGDLGRALGLDSGQISRVMNGRRRWSLAELEAMAHHFNVDIGIFFEEPEALVRSRCFRPAHSDAHQLQFNLAA
jgi:transcriptional regulator with XRE-family HTH domain